MQVVPKFTDVIKIRDGRFCDVELHEERIRSTIHHFFGKMIDVHFQDDSIPDHLRHGVVKCRVVYSDTIQDIEFSPYTFRKINTMVVVKSDSIEYEFKYLDRSCFNALRPPDSEFDEILIVKNGLVTDTSYSNVVFEDEDGALFTPVSTLLNGTKRQKLIRQGKIKERVICESDIWNYRKLYFINAMIDIEDKQGIPVSKLCR